MENGYILLHRKIKNKGYYRKSQYVHLWVHLLLSANHKENEFLWNGKIIKIKAGQFITGREELSKQTGIPQTTIERILDLLEKEGQIGQQKSNKNRIITIVNWNKYQINKSKADNRRTTDGQQTDTNNTTNNEKNDNTTKTEVSHFLKSSKDFIPIDWNSSLNKPAKYQTIKRIRYRIVYGNDHKKYCVPPEKGKYILYEELIKLNLK